MTVADAWISLRKQTACVKSQPQTLCILPFQVRTDKGHTIKPRQATVYATNSPINRNLAVHARQEANRTYMIGFKVPKGGYPVVTHTVLQCSIAAAARHKACT